MVKRILLFYTFFFWIGIFLGYSQGVKDYEFAGYFYPKDKEVLENMIDEFIQKANPPSLVGKIIGLISPHAGYIYSGSVAGYGYRLIKDKSYDTVIIMGPSHRYYFKGVAVYPKGAFNTPLYPLKIDEEIASELVKALNFVRAEPKYFYGEHSLEVELPFLQRVLKNFRIVPLVFGRVDNYQMQELAQKLKNISQQKKILLLVSTDLSHYHPYTEANSIDSVTSRKIEEVAGNWFYEKLADNRACGILPLITFLHYVKQQGAEIKVIKYANSGDTAGDKKRVVGYLSAIAYIKNKKGKKEGGIMGYSDEEKKLLLRIARATLESYLKDKKIPQFNVDSPKLQEKRGVFVTLKKNGQLRGCIGRIVGDIPLYKGVSKMAIAAATEDPRFPSVRFEELSNIEIEISVMTPLERVKSLDEIEVGKHGLMITKGFYSGLLLPQVPVEYGWDKTTFLQHLCYKAGLPPDSYKDKDAIIYKFSADVFSEKEFQE